ncbi:5'-methylthioadenosine/S-adenosylhomocysteine nucleosidase [Paenibacillus sp. S150]|uniref:5'-methylthioadenosine/S-adenosylhomocysteine nucleosidase n=1 Tax=Paenibacillus sp. S150 TaxID=2749826 RepID=UPI001C59B42F|nr:5'-methylthioadenosine/S-adenosylhomocysteine nucleosidase [Paenibacillus sp. S150]MBW4080713.1 5'-methylthioadenosine/S-adenosylhomocysteine nucleosidase [Paenibacillus sp. S150]
MAKKIAVIGAVEQEIFPLHEVLLHEPHWQRTERGTYHHPLLDLEVHTVVSGVGKVNSAYRTAELLAAFSPELVVNIGYAGGLVPHAQPGDIVIGTDYRQIDFVSLTEGFAAGMVPGASPNIVPDRFIGTVEQVSRSLGYRFFTGRIATGDFFLNDSIRKAEIIRDFAPVAFDMESAAIAHVCAAKGVAFAVVRVLSDLADEEAAIPLESELADIARRPVSVVLQSLKEFYGVSADSVLKLKLS